ncbi:MAG TPA: hypothetical protein VFM93_13225 [Candidatus Limnocylindria bacterium]|nr:hypothetical protein [Candidatus Limnocylindria bacterium]
MGTRAAAFRPLPFRSRPLDTALRPPLGGRLLPTLAWALPAVLIVSVGGLTALAARAGTLFACIVALAAVVAALAQMRATGAIRAEAEARIRRERRQVSELADSRVEALTRQFGWAVEDTARLGRELRKVRAERSAAQAGGLAAHREILQLRALVDDTTARLAELSPAEATELGGAAERIAGRAVRLWWGLHDDGMIRWLQLEGGTWDAVPSRVRVLLAETGGVVAVTQRSLASRTGAPGPARRGLASMVFQVPDAVVEALESGNACAYRFEAQVEDEWWPVELADSGCRSSASHQRLGRVVDKRGRIYGSAEAAD